MEKVTIFVKEVDPSFGSEMLNHKKNLTMKKIVLTLALLFCASFAMAQKGSLWLSGSFDYQSANQDLTNGSVKTRDLAFYPHLEYYLSDNWSVYAGVGVDYTRQSVLDNYRSTTFGPFIGVIRYFPVTDRFSFYAELGLSGFWGSAKDDLTKYSVSDYQIDLSPGINYAVTDKISLWTAVGLVGYQTKTNKDKNSGQKDTFNNFHANFLSQGISLGIAFRL